MPIDSDTLAMVLELGQACEDLARAALAVAQAQLRAKAIDQDDFDQAFQDYGLAMQKARDMYYQASHSLAQQVAASADLKTLIDQTTTLKNALERLQMTEHVLSISFGVVTVVAAVATAVLTPSAATIGAVASAAGTVGAAIAG